MSSSLKFLLLALITLFHLAGHGDHQIMGGQKNETQITQNLYPVKQTPNLRESAPKFFSVVHLDQLSEVFNVIEVLQQKGLFIGLPIYCCTYSFLRLNVLRSQAHPPNM